MTDKYANERGDPSGAACASVSLLFDGYYLKLQTGAAGTVTQAWHARSGHKVSGKFDYSPERQEVRNDGPIPEGEYWIQPSQMKTFLFESDGWGESRVTIHPRPGTVTHSRGGFFIHGGKVFGSAGCIDLAYGMKEFRLKVQSLAPHKFLGSNDCYIPLTVKYGDTLVDDP
jgi:Protein of unknown function (DUF2778)